MATARLGLRVDGFAEQQLVAIRRRLGDDITRQDPTGDVARGFEVRIHIDRGQHVNKFSAALQDRNLAPAGEGRQLLRTGVRRNIDFAFAHRRAMFRRCRQRAGKKQQASPRAAFRMRTYSSIDESPCLRASFSFITCASREGSTLPPLITGHHVVACAADCLHGTGRRQKSPLHSVLPPGASRSSSAAWLRGFRLLLP